MSKPFAEICFGVALGVIALWGGGCNWLDLSTETDIVENVTVPNFELVGSEAENQFDWMAVAGRVRFSPPSAESAGARQFLGYVKVSVQFLDGDDKLLAEDYTYIDSSESVWSADDEKDFLLVRARVEGYDHLQIILAGTPKPA